jgi:primosomal protein N' (replication factor Y)
MRYAEVSVNSPIAQGRTFSYGIPEGLSISIGQAVWVPFGVKTLQGIVIELTATPAVEQTKDIAGLIDPLPLLSLTQVALAKWLSGYYLTPLFEAVALMLPPAFERRVITYLTRAIDSNPQDDELKPYLAFLKTTEPIDQKIIEKHFGILKTKKAVARLVREKLVIRGYELEKERVKPQFVTYVKLNLPEDEALQNLTKIKSGSDKQAALLRYFIDNPHSQALPALKEKTGLPASTFKTLLDKGWLKKEDIRVERDPLANRGDPDGLSRFCFSTNLWFFAKNRDFRK